MTSAFPEKAFSEFVRRGSRLLGTSSARLVNLAPTRLVDDAKRRAGCDDFDGDAWREPFERLLHSFENDARLTLLGRIAARQDLLRHLVNRLRMQDDRHRLPEIGAERIEQPLFVTGLPRTGTTLLQGLLAQDPENRSPVNWEVMYPSPPPARSRGRRDRRIEIAERQIRWFHRLTPEFRKIHPVGAQLPEECLLITSHSFMSFQFQTSHRVTSYQRWLEDQDLRPSYEAHRQVLRHLQWRAQRRTWVLKAPAHLYGIEALFAVYPDARVVLTHRHPLEVVPSMASLHTVLRSTFSDDVDPAAVGREVTRRWSAGIDRALRARDAGAAPADRFHDVLYRELVRDPIGVVRRLYEQIGRRLTAAAEERMQRFLHESPKDKHGPHRYTLEQFGFDAAEERERYRPYIERFGL